MGVPCYEAVYEISRPKFTSQNEVKKKNGLYLARVIAHFAAKLQLLKGSLMQNIYLLLKKQ